MSDKEQVLQTLLDAANGEIGALTAECERLAEVRNAAGSVGDDAQFWDLFSQAAKWFELRFGGDEYMRARANLVTYIDSRAPAAPADSISLQELWEAADGAPDVRPNKELLLAAIRAPAAPVAQPLAPSGAVPEYDCPSCIERQTQEDIAATMDCYARPLAAQPLAASAVPEVTEREKSLYSALNAVMSWIHNWSPDFTNDPEWPADRDAARAALAAPSQQPAASPKPIPVPTDAKLWGDGIWRDSTGNTLGPAASPTEAK